HRKLGPRVQERVAVKYRLDHLKAESTEAYIKHRLRLAGASRMPFTPEAVTAVHRFSSGTPRVINTLCDNALFEGYVARAPMIDETMIEHVALDLGLGDGAAVTPQPPTGPLKKPTSTPPPEKPKVDLGEIDRYLAGLAKPN